MRLIIILICVLISACTPTKQYLGTSQPEYMDYACAIGNKECPYYRSNIGGSYFVERVSSGSYILKGTFS